MVDYTRDNLPQLLYCHTFIEITEKSKDKFQIDELTRLRVTKEDHIIVFRIISVLDKCVLLMTKDKYRVWCKDNGYMSFLSVKTLLSKHSL